MSMRPIHLAASVATAFIVAGVGLVPSQPAMAARPQRDAVTVSVPSRAAADRPFAIKVTLPADVSAVDGRLLFDRSAAELWGVAARRGAVAFRPERVPGGYAFGAYGLTPVGGRSVLRLVMSSRKPAQLQVRVVVGALADAAGQRLPRARNSYVADVDVAAGGPRLPASSAVEDTTPLRPAGPAREPLADGRFDRQDLDTVHLGWMTAAGRDDVCGTSRRVDVNGDGCTDIVDVQAVQALLGQSTARSVGPTATGDKTFTVVSTADAPDAAPGNGVCADASGLCTLRAAMMESSWVAGNDRIQFNLPGAAPVTIQVASQLPNIGSRSGTITIDGYTQPGSRRNDASAGSNAVMGVELRGPGVSTRMYGFYITSPGNTVQGLLLADFTRGIFIDRTDAHHNRILGNWIGFRRDGTNAPGGEHAIDLNGGAHDNVIGTAALADRNVMGNYSIGVDVYGTGTNANIIQGNQFCIRPSGTTTATCAVGIDHNFGPKNGLIGGAGAGERNVIGPTWLQGIEYSHGWNPSGPRGATDPTWEISGNRSIGNWVGFRGDGSYSASFRSGLNFSSADNGNGINVYDGSRNNTIQGNFVASVYDGIQLETQNSDGNIVRQNTIGVSPLGQAAPMTRWGIIVRQGTRYHVIQANTIRNAAAGGVGLVDKNNRGGGTTVAQNIRISRNIITDTNGPAIYLAPGANGSIAKPVITSATVSAVKGTAKAGATVEVYRASRQAGEYGLPTAFLGSTVTGSNGTWTLAVPLVLGERVTALQIDGASNTSELAANVLVGAAPPPPPSGSVIASDSFERTVSNGWGNADQGGSWALAGKAADFSVSGGAGRMNVAAGISREARLAIGTADVDLSGRVAFDRLPVGANAFAYLLARSNGSGSTTYRTTIRLSDTGAVFAKLTKVVDGVQSALAPEASTGITASPGGQLAFRQRVVGGHLQFRIWDAGAAEPSTWLTEADDSTAALQGPGGVGLRAYAAAGVSNGPVGVSFDAFEVRLP